MTASGMRKNEINRLSSEELTFELTYRGLPTSRVQEMRKSLRNVLKLEKIGTFANVTTVSFTDAAFSDSQRLSWEVQRKYYVYRFPLSICNFMSEITVITAL